MTAATPAPVRRLGWGVIIGFVLLVSAVSFAVTAGVFVALGNTASIVGDVAGFAVAIGVPAFVAHVLLLRLWPPATRWDCAVRAVLSSYVGLVAGTFIVQIAGEATGGIKLAVIAAVVFTLSGAFLVPGATALVSAPILGPAFRPWRLRRTPGGSAVVSTDHDAAAAETAAPDGPPAPPP